MNADTKFSLLPVGREYRIILGRESATGINSLERPYEWVIAACQQWENDHNMRLVYATWKADVLHPQIQTGVTSYEAGAYVWGYVPEDMGDEDAWKILVSLAEAIARKVSEWTLFVSLDGKVKMLSQF